MFTANQNVTSTKNYKQLAEDSWKKAEKINGELFSLTYGCFVAQLLRDLEDPKSVNAHLEKVGYSMGTRLIDEFLSKTSGKCQDWRETSEMVKVALRQFLGVQPGLVIGEKEFTLTLPLGEDNIGSEIVELPVEASNGDLHYSSIICGVIRGALEMVNIQVECIVTKDPLLSSDLNCTEIKVKLLKYLEGEHPPEE